MLKSNTCPDAMAIHSMIGFFNTFLHLHNSYFSKESPVPRSDILQSSSNKAIYSFPYAVNGAFAIEIALKSLMNETNAKQCSHDIKKAFQNNQIPDNIKISIKKRFYSYNLTESDFDDTLSKASNLFVEWRYGFQSANNIMVPEYFFELTDSICRVIAELYDRTITE